MANTPSRVCPLAKKCGGCQLQNLSYDEQLHLKQATAIRLLGRFGHVEEIIGMKDPYHYRNKVQAAFGVNRQGQIISGVYQSASHRIVPVSNCMIEDTVADQIIVTIRGLLKSFKIRPYDEETGRGTLRHVLVRRGWRSGEILVVLVTAHGMLPGKRNFVRALLQRHPDITTIVQNINAGQTSLVLGPHSEVLYGPGYIREQLGDFTFRISPRAFYQINPVQTEVLYRTALDYAGLAGKETVVDAYCGTGTIGIFAGTAINDTSSVTAAASTWDSLYGLGSQTLDKAVTVKLTRTLAIIPITLVLAFVRTKRAKTDGTKVNFKKIFPMFILYFLLASVITTICVSAGVSASVFTPLKTLSKFLIVMAMCAVGLNTNIVKLVRTGGKPLIMGFCCWVGIAGMSLLMQHVLGIW